VKMYRSPQNDDATGFGHEVQTAKQDETCATSSAAESVLRKMRWHSHRFALTEDPHAIVARYAACLETGQWPAGGITRHAAHVAAWAALAPFGTGALRDVFLLLCRRLDSIGAEGHTQRLSLSLELVHERLCKLSSEEVGSDVLRKLCKSLALKPQENSHSLQSVKRVRPASCLKRKTGDRQSWKSGMQACTDASWSTSVPPDVQLQLGQDCDHQGTKGAKLFHRACSHWQNMTDPHEREKWLAALEQKLIASLDEGGRSLRSVFRAAVAALAMPHGIQTQVRTAAPSADLQGHYCHKMQRRLRQIVLRVLQCGLVDLADVRIGPAVMRLQVLLNKMELDPTRSRNGQTLTSHEHWALIHGAILTSYERCRFESKQLSDSTNNGNELAGGIASRNSGSVVNEGMCTVQNPFSQDNRQANKHRANISADGVYTPNVKIQRLRSVYCKAEKAVLECPGCGFRLVSSWFFRKDGVDTLLRPCNVHSPCRKMGLKHRFRTVDGRPCTDDLYRQLHLCKHGSRKVLCVQCRGKQICHHGRRRYRCCLCKAAKLHKTG